MRRTDMRTNVRTALFILTLLLTLLLSATAALAGGDGSGGDGSGGGSGENHPYLTSSVPADGATEVSPTATLVLNFSNNVINAAVRDNNSGCFSLRDADGNEVAISVLMGDDQVDPDARRTISVVPAAPLQPGVSYTLSISQSLTAKNGNSMTAPASVSFSVAAVEAVEAAPVEAAPVEVEPVEVEPEVEAAPEVEVEPEATAEVEAEIEAAPEAEAEAEATTAVQAPTLAAQVAAETEAETTTETAAATEPAPDLPLGLLIVGATLLVAAVVLALRRLAR